MFEISFNRRTYTGVKEEFKTAYAFKFEFSEKATKFEKIFVLLLTRASCSVHETAYLSKSRRRFFKTNVDKLYNTNFKSYFKFHESQQKQHTVYKQRHL